MFNRIKVFLYVLFSLFISSFQAFAQQNEVEKISRELSAHKNQDTTRVYLLNKLANSYHQIRPDSTVILSKEAYTLAKKLNYKMGIADALNFWAIGSYIYSFSDQALVKCREALALYRELGDIKKEAALLNNIAMIFNNQGDYKGALIYYELSLKKRTAINDSVGMAGSYNNIGNTYCDLGKYATALEYLFKGLNIREKLPDTSAIANSYTNIGTIYFLLAKYSLADKYNEIAFNWFKVLGNKNGIFQCNITSGGIQIEQKNYKSALVFYERALEVASEMKSKSAEAVARTNIGVASVKLGLYDNAIENYEKALAFSIKGNDIEGMVVCYLGLGRAYLKQNKINLALTNLTIGYNEAKVLGKTTRIYDVAKALAEAYELQEDFNKANKYLRESITLRDSLFNDESIKKIHEVEYSYALDKKQKEIELLEKDKFIQAGINQQQTTVVTFLIALALVMVIALFYINGIRNKEKRLKEKTLLQKQEIEVQSVKLQELNTLKDKTFSVLSHDLRSPVSALVGVMDLMNQKLITTEDFNSLKGNLTQQLKSLSLLLDNLLNWSRTHMQGYSNPVVEEIPLSLSVTKNIALLTEFASQKSVLLTTTVANNIMLCADKDHLDIILRNLISNAIKYSNANSKIVVDAAKGNDEVVFSVTDFGVGMKPETLASLFSEKVKVGYGTNGEKGTGLGLLLCKEFVTRNNGTIRVESELGKGTTFFVTLPTKCA